MLLVKYININLLNNTIENPFKTYIHHGPVAVAEFATG
jgi:hypothetical protein